uniref:Zinc finger protein RFP-like n=1 Tax=Salvator merianae TaxID=96440 RepID=A0A8D0C0T4_SALMN
MAGVELVRGLSEEATCSVCLDYFKDPVMIPECGHNLCRGCLDQCCGEAAEGTCPQCRLTFRRGNIGPNRQLANMVEMVRKLTLRGAEGEQERVCEQHQKPKHLFCWDDKTLICVTCERKDHKGHETLLLEDAAQKYVGQIRNHLEFLTEKKEKILEGNGEATRGSQSMLEQIKTDREKTMKVFRQLHQFLDEEEKCWLAEMDDIVKEVERVMEDQLEKHVKQLQSLERIIQAMEEKLQQPATDLLQDIENFLESHLVAHSSEDSAVTPSAVFRWRTLDFCDSPSILRRMMQQLQGSSLQ